MIVTLTSSISGEIIPGAFVAVVSEQDIEIPNDAVGIIGIRKSWGDKLVLGATLAEPGYNGKLLLQLTNRSHRTIEIRKGEELCNLVLVQAW